MSTAGQRSTSEPKRRYGAREAAWRRKLSLRGGHIGCRLTQILLWRL